MTEDNEPKKYIQLGTGEETTKDDPDRGVWYSASPHCSYWTDEWDLLHRTLPHEDKPTDCRTAGWENGIPCCPICSSVGMEITHREWFYKAKVFDKKNHPRYVEFLEVNHQVCGKVSGLTFLQRYQKFTDDNLKSLPGSPDRPS